MENSNSAASPAPAAAPAVVTPSLKRRLIAMVYEAFLLFAVEVFAVGVYMLITLNAQGMIFQLGMTIWVILAAGAYFCWQWIDSGHTLAMKTWRIKVVELGERKLTFKTAAKRYAGALCFVAPAVLISFIINAFELLPTRTATKVTFGLILVNIVAWACTALLDRNRQFLHDRWAGTRLIELPKKTK
jgi:uncharacterized RDD family membrane protein YckC